MTINYFQLAAAAFLGHFVLNFTGAFANSFTERGRRRFGIFIDFFVAVIAVVICAL